MKILGVGGHAKVVIDAAVNAGFSISAIFDDDQSKHGESLQGYEVEGNILPELRGSAIIAIGNNSIRKKIANKLRDCNWEVIIHPSAVIADDVTIGAGSVIMAGAVIQPGTRIGDHVIVNTGACIDHDCQIGDYCHIGPNNSIAGGVKIGEGTLLGVGSSVIQYLEIGEWSTIGAGGVVTKNIPSNCTAVGVPAKPIKFHNEQR